MARADTSPMHPAIFPRKALLKGGRFPWPFFSKAKGVAVVTPSNVNMLMLSGQAANKKALAAKAGFIKLQPIPPKICFTNTIATIEPIHATQRGVLIGRFKASKTPVTIALKSFMVICYFLKGVFRNCS